MLTASKRAKLLSSLKTYNKKFLRGKPAELDESGTRLMINSFLTDVLGFTPIEEVKTEYMIRGTYADYVIQTKGTRHFLIEVKSLSLSLSDKHLRQAINYGANEGIEWALLTNGKQIDFYKIIFEKPIDRRLVFSFDLSDITKLKNCIETLQFLHRDSVLNKGLDRLWQKTVALDPKNVSGLLYAKPVMNFIKRTLNKKYRNKFSDEEIQNSISRIICEEIQLIDVKQVKLRKTKRKLKVSNGKGSSSAETPESQQATSIS
ncbi:MAG: type I restriction enzyme HsdR N-terminal domain-containing protein [Chitinophagaceae bacterium]|nr:type I restriction enzyme HsdR N-terminal domain-containing protein [Chitinophagaceae bacterium]